MRNDDDDSGEAPGEALGETVTVDASRELEAMLDEMVTLLKSPDVVASLTKRGVNASLALLAVDGLSAYLTGEKRQAADNLRTVAEEIEGRLRFGNDPPSA